MEGDPDADVVVRSQAGDREAFRELVDRYHGKVFRLIFGIVGDWQLAEDVSQDVFVSVFSRLDSFGFRSKFSTWIYRVGVNAALKARGRAARYRGRHPALDDSDGVGPLQEDERPAEIAGSEMVAKLLRPLPEHLRAVVLLKDRDGLTYKEIAQILDCSAGAVEQRLHRAYVRLREIWRSRRQELGFDEDTE